MVIVLPAVLLFGVLTWLLIRARTIRALEAVVVGLFGFFLSSTGLGPALGAFLVTLFGLPGQVHGPGPGQGPAGSPTSVVSPSGMSESRVPR